MASERFQRQIERLLDEAEASVFQFDWEKVRQCAHAVLAIDPGNSDALIFLTNAERALGATTLPSSQPTAHAPATAPTATTGHPTSFANGRYQVKQLLGEGGKKKVYLAHDSLLDREVAFALIKTEGLDDTSRARIQREAQAMGRLGSHPHIVTVFDLGQEQDQPYMVTEFMGGGDVEGLVEDAEGDSLALEQALSIAKETCQALEFAHSRGIVHRDLKPGNVWLTGDGIAKIGDFGLAVALDRSRLTTEGMMVGTVSYMPPEQAMGGEVTPRSDLYSLGAMLYEMVTGRPPFLGDDSVAIIGQHINTPPVAPNWHNRQCPNALDALILRLLAKDPTERPESATDVLSALDAIDLTEVGAMHASPLQDEAHALDSLAGGVFVGRQREMGELKACLEDALSGRGRLVTLVGEPGIGKTRTAQELATNAGLRGAQVLWGRSYEEQGVPPYWPWVQAIRSYVRERDPEQLRSEMGAGAADIAEVVSDVRERLPGLPSAPQLEPEQARFRLFDSITAFLKTASQRQPLVLVLDDLHWADQPSLMLLQFVARELGGARLLIIGNYRDMELSRQHPLAEALGELTRERLFQRVLLRGITQEDVERFIEMTSGNSAPRGLVEAVHTQTEGNPLFVTEVVRLLVQEGELSAEQFREGESWTIRIPEGVREVIGRRLNRLSQRCNEVLTVASIIGREFTLAQLKPWVEEVSDDRLFEILEEALAARVIEEFPQSMGRYQFTHALIQETLTAEVSLTRRVRLHAEIAEALEKLYGDNAEAHAAELAHHFAQAEAVTGTEKLVRYSLLAGERALASYAWEEAQAGFQQVLTAKEVLLATTNSDSEMDSETASALFGLARAQLHTAQRDQIAMAAANLRRAFEHFFDAGDVSRAVVAATYQLPYTPGRFTVGEMVSKALTLVPHESHEAGRLHSAHARVLGIEELDYNGAHEAARRAIGIAQGENDVALELRTLIQASYVDFYHTRWLASLGNSRRSIELVRHTDDPYAEASAHFLAASSLYVLGELEEADGHAAASLAPAERSNDRTRLSTVLWASQALSHAKGDWNSGRTFADRGFATARDPRFSLSRAVLEYETGEPGEGEAYLKQALDIISLTPPGPTLEHAYLALTIAEICRITGKFDRSDVAEISGHAVLSNKSAMPLFRLMARVGLAVIAVVRRDTEKSGGHYAALLSHAGTMLGRCEMCGDRLLGLLSQTMGNLDQAMSHFEDALTFCRKAGYRPELAWTCCDYADTLKERDAEGDRANAMSLLDESLAISSELGMRLLMERALSRREILKA